MHRPEGAEGMADNGRVSQAGPEPRDPTVVESLSVLADGDAPGTDVFVPFTSPDNLGISDMSLMVQEDTREAQNLAVPPRRAVLALGGQRHRS